MRIFGKKVFTRRPLTLEEQEKRQAQERLQNIRNIGKQRRAEESAAQKEQRIRQEMKGAERDTKMAQLIADRERAVTKAREAQRKRPIISSGIAGGLVSMVKKAKAPSTRTGVSGRTVYVKTARGYKPTYIETPVSSTPAAKSQEVKKDDWWDVPPAFRGL